VWDVVIGRGVCDSHGVVTEYLCCGLFVWCSVFCGWWFGFGGFTFVARSFLVFVFCFYLSRFVLRYDLVFVFIGLAGLGWYVKGLLGMCGMVVCSFFL